MNKYIVASIFCAGVFASSLPVFADAKPYVCGGKEISGKLETIDPEHTTIKIVLSQNGIEKYSFEPSIQDDGSYALAVDYGMIIPGEYTIISTARLGEIEDTRSYTAYVGATNCPTLAFEEMSDTQKDAFREKIVDMANEVDDYQNNVATEFVLPSEFLATGGPFQFVDDVIKKLGLKFASSKSDVYHTVPERTLDPNGDYDDLGFQEFYSSLPEEYRHAKAYLRFKGLFVPIQYAGKEMTSEEMLSLLNKGMSLAPQTSSLDVIGKVKMLYAHSLSFDASPFAGIGSYLSVFSTGGDEVTIYTRSKGTSYDTRRYTVKSKIQVKPEQTAMLEKFNKEGADSIAIITCRDGKVLGSTQGREILLLERRSEELGKFQLSVQQVADSEKLAAAKKKIDAYLKKKDLDEKQIVTLVQKLEAVEKKSKGNPLAAITTYGKYMATYDAVYNDNALEG